MGVPKNYPQSKEAMKESAMAAKGSRLYQSERSAENDEAIRLTVGKLANEMRVQASREGKIFLADTERVREIALEYLDVCQECSSLPSMSGLARCLGVSRNALYWHIKNRDDATSEFLKEFSDACSETISTAALKGCVQPVVAIFTLKARYSWRDVVSVEASTANSPLGKVVDVDEIARRYQLLPED